MYMSDAASQAEQPDQTSGSRKPDQLNVKSNSVLVSNFWSEPQSEIWKNRDIFHFGDKMKNKITSQFFIIWFLIGNLKNWKERMIPWLYRTTQVWNSSDLRSGSSPAWSLRSLHRNHFWFARWISSQKHEVRRYKIRVGYRWRLLIGCWSSCDHRGV